MSNVSFLEFQYKLSKNKFLRKPSRLFSRDRQNSGLIPAFQPDLNELRKVFDKFDSNKDGKISRMEYKAILRGLVQGNMIRDVPRIFRVADFDGDGFINFKDFVEVHKRSGGVKTMDIQSAFRAFDQNCDGKISAEEVMEMLRRLGESCTFEDCRKMVRAVDTDGDGMVNMDEFMTMMTRTMKYD
ncbi:Calcium-binding EF-hand [Corchorus olitorius]|uniref:Calcium-binding EF-hand n=1 Tax=Corchorus olitorius TaxID=93759 RepID=A0A1R3GZ06_9ROSI|nr:Calcium-binding EF-hand [Corchorus olitorius]